MTRFLIATSDERFWRLDRPVLFLGEWCRLYDRKHLWESMDAMVARPFGLGADELQKNAESVQLLNRQLLQELALALNRIHQTQHPVRYWHIMVGPWLYLFVGTLFNRYHTFKQALNEYEVEAMAVVSGGAPETSTDTMSFARIVTDSSWDQRVFSEVAKYLRPNSVDLVTISSEDEIVSPALDGDHRNLAGQWTKRWALALISKLALFSRQNDAFIINSYLPQFEELLLQLSLGQIPQRWKSPEAPAIPRDDDVRQRLQVNASNYSGFERFARLQLVEMLPTCFLEGYAALSWQIQSLRWPANPKFIFTSNNCFYDEVFKAWTARQVGRGVPYVVGQHGNGYGTHASNDNLPEMVATDRFLTWGWRDDSIEKVPAFVFTIAGRGGDPVPTPNGGLLLVENTVSPRYTPEDSYFPHGQYQEDQFSFVDELPDRIRDNLTVRLYGTHRTLAWNDQQRWRDRFSSVRLETGQVKFNKLVAQSRLTVYSYDSTGLLESLALNLPTMCFWRDGFNHVSPKAKPYYELLRKAGIFVDKPRCVASLVAVRWDAIHAWWNSDEVQVPRKAFCAQYARTSSRPIRTLKALLTAPYA